MEDKEYIKALDDEIRKAVEHIAEQIPGAIVMLVIAVPKTDEPDATTVRYGSNIRRRLFLQWFQDVYSEIKARITEEN